jgi:hypothetical protein
VEHCRNACGRLLLGQPFDQCLCLFQNFSYDSVSSRLFDEIGAIVIFCRILGR